METNCFPIIALVFIHEELLSERQLYTWFLPIDLLKKLNLNPGHIDGTDVCREGVQRDVLFVDEPLIGKTSVREKNTVVYL